MAELMSHREGQLTLGSLFDGSGGFPLAGVIHGIEPVWASEIEPFPIRVTQNRFPNMKHLGSVTDVDGTKVEPVDVITFGSPCFPAGTLVNTDSGYKPIEQITVTDKVLTHLGRYRQVLNAQYTGTKTLMRLRAMGVHEIVSTENHLFYAMRKDGSVEWVRMDSLTGSDRIAMPINVMSENPMELTEQECWLIGRYIADGYTRTQQRPERPEGSVYATTVFCIGDGKETLFEENADGIRYGKSQETRNVTKYTIHSHRLTQLCNACGNGAENKMIPAFLQNLPKKLLAKVLDGYFSGDGCTVGDLRKATTVSEKLAYSLAQAIGKAYERPCRVYKTDVPETTVIEGRTVNQRPQWQVVYSMIGSDRDRAVCDGMYSWLPVRSVERLDEKKAVYDLTVAEDHSFCVQNIAVHNCQDLSVAGKQLGIHDGERSNLFFEAIRIIKEMRDATSNQFPRFAVWENVPGAFSSNKGEDFRAVLQAFAEICEGGCGVSVPMPPKGKWLHAGTVVGNGWSVAWRVYDAQFWGVPQRRKRIYLVADFRSERAGEILFKPESVSGHSETGGKEGEGTSGDAEGGPGGSDQTFNESGVGYWMPGFGCLRAEGENRPSRPNHVIVDSVKCLNPWDVQSKRQYEIDGAYCTLNAGQAVGGQAHGVCFALDSMASNSMKSANPNSGFHEEPVTKTLDTNPDPTCNQGGNVIVETTAFTNRASPTQEIAETLRAESHGAIPMIASFMGGQGAKARSIAYCDDGSTPTIKSAPSGGNTVPDVVYPINTMVATRGGKDDMRTCFGIGEANDPQFTLSAAHEHGVCYCMEGNTVDRDSGKNGKGFCEDVSPTLNTQDRHAVTYAIEGNGTRDSHKGDGYRESDTMYTLNTTEQHAVCFQQNQREEVRDMGKKAGAITAEAGMHNTNYVILNDQGGQFMDVSDNKAGCLRAEEHAHQPIVAYECEGMSHDLFSTKFLKDGKTDPLASTDYKEPPVVCYGIEPGAAQRLNTEQRISENVSPTLRANMGDNQPAVAYGVDCRNGVIEKEKVHTIQAKPNGGMSVNCTPNVLLKNNQIHDLLCYEGQNLCVDDDKAFTIQAGRPDDHHISTVVYSVENHSADSRVTIRDDDKCQTLTSRMGTGGNNVPMILEIVDE